jgi:hypothetical protein
MQAHDDPDEQQAHDKDDGRSTANNEIHQHSNVNRESASKERGKEFSIATEECTAIQ